MHCVDLGESFPTHIFLHNLASILLRTSPVKFACSPRTDSPGIGFLFVVSAALFFGIYKMKAPAVAVEGGKIQRLASGAKPKEPPQREESGRLARQLTASGRGPFKHDPAVPEPRPVGAAPSQAPASTAPAPAPLPPSVLGGKTPAAPPAPFAGVRPEGSLGTPAIRSSDIEATAVVPTPAEAPWPKTMFSLFFF